MVDQIQKQLEAAVKPPLRSLDTILVNEVDQSIHRHLRTKQVVTLFSSELKEIVEKYGRPENKLYSSFNDVEEQDFSGLHEGYGISEYFGGEGMYIPSPEYLMYMKNLDKDFVMNVYHGSRVNIPIQVVQNKIRKVADRDLPVGFNFPDVSSVNYTVFNGTKYQQDVRIGKYMYKFPVLSVNLPYEYYSLQDIPEHIYTIDFDRQEYRLANFAQKGIEDLFQDICQNGIRKHLFMQVKNGRIVSADDETYAIMLIATYLKLPTIPVTLYMVNNSTTGNLLISNRKIDLINKFSQDARDTSKEEIRLINEVCEGKFIFYHNGYNDDVIPVVMNADYVPSTPVAGDTIKDHQMVDFYLDEKHQEPDIPQRANGSDEEVAALHHKMMVEAQKRIDDQIAAAINSLNS